MENNNRYIDDRNPGRGGMENLREADPRLFDALYPHISRMADHLRSTYPEGYRFADDMINHYADHVLDNYGPFDGGAVTAAADPVGGRRTRDFARTLLSGLLFGTLFPYDYPYYPYYPWPVYFGGGFRRGPGGFHGGHGGHGGGHGGRR
ncbi:MAG: hypothetical protein FWE86_00020 [Oscillospiraceae bacterium]|nr:hypothetical protein [Oscillospiraceae bacterium]